MFEMNQALLFAHVLYLTLSLSLSLSFSLLDRILTAGS